MTEGRYDDAEKSLLEAKRVYTASHGKDFVDVAETLRQLGQTYDHMGKHQESLGLFLDSLQIERRNGMDRSEGGGFSYNLIGRSLAALGKHKEALVRIEQAREIFEEVFGPDDERVGITLVEMGSTNKELKQPERALEMQTEALRIFLLTNNKQNVAAALGNIGGLYYDQKRYAEAKANFEEGLSIYRRAHGEKHPDVGMSFFNLGNVLRMQGEHDESLKLYKMALKISRRVYGEDHHEVGKVIQNMALVLIVQDKHHEAVRLFEQAIGIYKGALSSQREVRIPTQPDRQGNTPARFWRRGRRPQSAAKREGGCANVRRARHHMLGVRRLLFRVLGGRPSPQESTRGQICATGARGGTEA